MVLIGCVMLIGGALIAHFLDGLVLSSIGLCVMVGGSLLINKSLF